MSSKTILVTAATGKIGKYLVPILLEKKYTVHALVRSLDSPASCKLESMGTKLFQGDFDDLDAIKAAAKGVDGVLINTVPTFGSFKELDHLHNVIQASKEAGATTAVYISGTRPHRINEFPNYGPTHPMYHLYECKIKGEAAVREAGFQSWTILRPVTFMDNLFDPRLAAMQFPHLRTEHTLLTSLTPTVKFDLIDPLTIAEYAEAAFTDPEVLKSQIIELASEKPTLDEMVADLTRVIGKEIKAVYVSKEEAAARGVSPVIMEYWDILKKYNDDVDLATLKGYPVKLHTFSEYLERNKDWIVPQF
jgi:uncharacterized protein YbjT (DUF2867 family)